MIRGGHNDRNTFASTYERAAAELTFNSRPLITSLSDIAYENRRFADIVGAILENRIRQNPPHQKLPVMYLVDSIIKRGGREFVDYFAKSLYGTFMNTFEQVDDTTRSSLLYLLQTWVDSRVFDPNLLQAIDRSARDAVARSGRQLPPRQTSTVPAANVGRSQIPSYQHPAAGNSTANAALAELDTAEAAILQRLYVLLTGNTNPVQARDLLAQKPVILQQLQLQISMAITQGQMPNQEVVQLIAQLQQIVQLRNTLQQQTQQALPAVGLAAMPPASGFGLGPPALAGVASMNSYGSHVPLGVQAQPGNMPPAPVQAPPSIPPISIPNSLFQSLSAAVGAMNAASAAPQASASVPAPVITRQQSSEPYQTPSFSNLESLRRKNTTAIASLYTDFKHQCPQCALRFSERQKLDEHLDWHFQQKRKEKQKAKKAVSRQWLLSAADWIEYKGGLTEPDLKSAAFGVDQKEEVKESSVVADETQKVCAACGEAFEQFYDQTGTNGQLSMALGRCLMNGAADEWMFKNALRGVDNKLYHSQCYSGAPIGTNITASDLGDRLGKKRTLEEITPLGAVDSVADTDPKRPKSETM